MVAVKRAQLATSLVARTPGTDFLSLQRHALTDDVAKMVLGDAFEASGASPDEQRLLLASAWDAEGRTDVARLWRDELPPPAMKRRRKSIESMTKAETARMTPHANRWIDIGLSTARADRPLFEAGANAIYRRLGWKAPRIVWTSSPIAVALASPIAAYLIAKGSRRDAVHGAVRGAVHGAVGDAVRGAVHGAVHGAVDGAVRGAVGDAVGDAVRGAVGDAVDGAVRVAVGDAVRGAVRGAVHGAVDGAVRGAVGDAVDGAVRDAVHGAVRGAVHGAVGDAVRDAVRGAVHGAVDGAVDGAVRGAVGDAVDGAVRGAVGDAVHGAVRGAVRGAVHGAVGDAVRDAVRGAVQTELSTTLSNLWHHYMGGQFWVGGYYWYGDPASASFFVDEMGLELKREGLAPGELETRARAYWATSMAACWWFPHTDFVIVSERPTTLVKHDRTTLDHVAWEWKDENGSTQTWKVGAK